MESKSILEIFQKLLEYEKIVTESTSTGGSGSFRVPLRPGLKLWGKDTLEPFTIPLSGYDNAEIYVDSLDGNIDTKDVKRKEGIAKKVSNYDKKHPIQNDEDGSDLNDNAVNKKLLKKVLGKKKIQETTNTSLSAGEYSGPIEIGLKKWRESELGPFVNDSNHHTTDKAKKKNLKNNIKKIVGMWEKHKDSGYEIPTHDVHTIKEDLGVWFGTKKKPKGSKQPKGPWVNICSKKDGKHPPCGRPDASNKSYPKCRAVGVAAKMTDSQKQSACQQKRKSEKKDTQTGKGQKPVMTTYKPKKKKTNESVLISLIRKALD
jgi:hypothetical protein